MFGSLGMSEILLILVIALIVFGPRKLPQLGRSLGESLAQFRKASEDFKRSWEQEITVEEKRLGAATPSSSSPSSEKEPASESQHESVSKSES
jgi:TatA/E family protein of Tat protein translocase